LSLGGISDLSLLTVLLVGARILANPVSNVFQKQLTRRSFHPVVIIGATHALLSLAVLPVLPVVPGTSDFLAQSAFWWNLIFCAVLAVASNGLLVEALRTSDLSVLGPINAYKALISLGLGVFWLGEKPTAIGLLGMGLILAGSYGVMDRAPEQSRRRAWTDFLRERGVQLRFAALVLSATEAVFLKRAILVSTPLAAFVWWCLLGFLVSAMLVPILARGRVVRELGFLRRDGGVFGALAATTGLMQLTTLLTFGRLPVGYSLALFQLSTLVSVGLGYHYFQEKNFRRRLLGAGVMVAGAALIALGGTHH
jgi:drug/metabolite transporter (DMT)-like permease